MNSNVEARRRALERQQWLVEAGFGDTGVQPTGDGAWEAFARIPDEQGELVLRDMSSGWPGFTAIWHRSTAGFPGERPVDCLEPADAVTYLARHASLVDRGAYGAFGHK